jgi:hypothetical protein
MAKSGAVFCRPVGRVQIAQLCYAATMTKEQVKEILDRVLTWPPERQEDAAEILMSIEAQDNSGYRLTDEQLAELRRRRAEKNPRTLTLAEFDKRLRRFAR